MTDTWRANPSPPVALVNMPFSLIHHPSLALGLLKAHLARLDIGAVVHNLNIRLATRIGLERYNRMAMAQPTVLSGEWIFTDALWGPDAAAEQAYREQILAVPKKVESWSQIESLEALLDEVREHAEPFLDACMADIDWGRYKIVGLTSVFQQHVASLALAKRIKAAHPDVFIVMGGANCEGDMGAATFAGFEHVDAVCSGESDATFGLLARQVLAGESIGELQGVLHRQRTGGLRIIGDGVEATHAPPVELMDDLPYPNFDEYFQDMAAAFPDEPTRIMYETSRGCWWGAKQHCTFCGLNGGSMGFRHKTAKRALEELLWLLERYGAHTRVISATDNIIPMAYFRDFLPSLKAMNVDLELFYETKSNLKREQVELYADAGLTHIQPGVESLSSDVLRIMKKGVTRLQNIQVLKWCRQYGVSAAWNYIIGFPGEAPEHYAGLPDIVASIAHLEPPDGWGTVRFDRFSPYLTRPEDHGVRNLKPYPAYAHVYRGLEPALVERQAYYFLGEFDGQERIREYTADLITALADWRDNGDNYALFTMQVDERLQVFDLRPGAETLNVTLEGADRTVYEACDQIATRRSLGRRLPALDETQITDAADRLLGLRLLIAEADQLLAVGIPLGYRWAPTGPAKRRFVEALRAPDAA